MDFTKELTKLVRELIDQQTNSYSTDAVCEIDSVNDDGTLNVYVLPFKDVLVKNIVNESRYDFKKGDSALLYLIKNRLSNSFVFAKFNPQKERKTLDANQITQITQIVNNASSKQFEFPIGYVYISANSTSPASLFGGTWEKLEGRFLVAEGTSDSTFVAGNSGGQSNVTLTIAQMPSHTHTNNGFYSGDPYQPEQGNYPVNVTPNVSSNWQSNASNVSGGNEPHTNLPPYLVVYMWKKVG